MEKWLCIGSIAIAVIMFVLFLLDLTISFPFTGSGKDSPFTLVDVAGMLGAGIVAYLGWNAFRDVK